MTVRIPRGFLRSPATVYIAGFATAAGAIAAAWLVPAAHRAPHIIQAFVIGAILGAGALAVGIIGCLFVSFSRNRSQDE